MSSWADDVEEELNTTTTIPSFADRLGPKPTDQSSSSNMEPESTAVENGQIQQDDNEEVNDLIKNQHTVTVKLVDQQADPNSPLYSIKTFEELNLSEPLLKGLYSMKFNKPSKIQEKALPLLLSNPPRNMIGQSQSGTGKTAAFALTMLSRVDPKIQAPQAVCLAPSRELAIQIQDVVTTMAKFMPEIKIQLAAKESVAKGATVDAQIVVGTPGTVLELCKRKQMNVSQVKVFVLDEADEMINQQGLGEQSLRCKNTVGRNAQIVLFSATFPEAVRNYAQKFAPEANQIELKREELSVEGIRQLWMDCKSQSHKYEVLAELYNVLTIGQSIIFARTKASVMEIAKRLEADGHACVALTGDLEPTQRDHVMSSFRAGSHKVLITTNVIARGIDVLQVNMVVNYDMPLTPPPESRPDPATYLHRIGRTGRFGRIGVSINFVCDERSLREMQAIERYLGVKMIKVPTDDVEETEKVIKAALKV
ncbi:RNA helicase required for poly(A+) mRNA export [Saitoella coloradoensis]